VNHRTFERILRSLVFRRACLFEWAVSFRRAGAMLWMVPAGLVLAGAPLLAWLSVVASGPEPPPPPPC